MVVGPRHANAFRTFGDRAIVTGNWLRCLPCTIGQDREALSASKEAGNGGHVGRLCAVETAPVTQFGIAVLVSDDLDVAITRQVGPWLSCLPGDTYAGHVTIDHLTGEPAYLQLARNLREMITSGEIAPRQPMPSIKSVTQQYGVAKGTAEKAFGVLRDEGLVVTVPGRGIYVIDR